MLVGPVDRNSWGDLEVRERRLAIKRAALEKAEKEEEEKRKNGGKGNDEDKVRSPGRNVGDGAWRLPALMKGMDKYANGRSIQRVACACLEDKGDVNAKVCFGLLFGCV